MINFLSTYKGTLLESFIPAGWDMARIDACCLNGVDDALTRQAHWHPDFAPIACDSVEDFNMMMGHEIAMEIRRTGEEGLKLAMIAPVGPMGMYRWAVFFLKEWNISCAHVYCFTMDEWSDGEGNTLEASNPGSFEYAMTNAFFNKLGELTVPPAQRNFATKENLPTYAEKIAALKKDGAKLITIFGIGRCFHIAFWEPQYAAEYASVEEWKAQTHRIAAKLHPLTIEQNAITSFQSRTTLVACTANTIGPGLFLQSDRIIGGADGYMGRGMQWQGLSLGVTLRYKPDPWVTSSFMPTLPGRLFFLKELAGPLLPDVN
ncbi:MAG: hypothetical protein FWC78_08890 [Defluviitaleaceae bacterium]|nr:hypothetical protein [Defluviitaleaceae bacterium]